jgi:hypothetical protein
MVRKAGERLKCSACRKTRKAFTVEQLGEKLELVLRANIRLGRMIGDSEDGYEQSGDSLNFWVQEAIGECHGLDDEIVDAVVGAEDVDVPGGEEPFFDESASYDSIPASILEHKSEWDLVSKDLKNSRRFFSTVAKDFFDRLFRDIESMETWNGETRQYESVVRTVPGGMKLYRARKLDPARLKEFYKEPFKSVGPPPPEKSLAGRMNVEGIVAFYGATDSETCLAEVRPAIGGTTAVIEVETSAQVTLLDFTRLQASRKVLSYFQPDFVAEAERTAFLRHLHTLISQPVVPGRESEYLITQTMAEYLAYVHKNPLDGILFQSVQRKDGVNLVLFAKLPTPANPFPLNYVARSFRVYATQGITYEHFEKRVYEYGGDVSFEHEYDGDEN